MMKLTISSQSSLSVICNNTQIILLVFKAVRSDLKLGVNLSNNLAKYEVFSFQCFLPIGALELRSMTSELKIQVSVLTIATESMCFN